MKIPRPPYWQSGVVRRFRTYWHLHGLPCPFCRIETGRWR